ncbi:MAG: GNAT family N-acetyltransferase [Bacteroidales bacterium]|nr:GNAT family N-acetyltransferase [Bacteroidales bacterium]
MRNDILIRIITSEDYELITSLTNQLGPNVQSDIVKDQIDKILNNPDHFAFVAVLDEEVVGYIHCFNAIRLTSKPFTEICGLVVDEKERGNGIGKLLVKHVETLFNDNRKIRVRCNVKRDLAHKFYSDLGYSLSKEQMIFEKKDFKNNPLSPTQ